MGATGIQEKEEEEVVVVVGLIVIVVVTEIKCKYFNIVKSQSA
jgi:hypothetical protein